MPTIFNPYDAKIDLTTKDGKKMYMDACKGLKEKDLYDGTKKNWNGFVKLMRKPLNDVRVMEVLKVTTKWDEDNIDDAGKRMVVEDANLFDRHNLSTKQVIDYVNLFWSETAHGADTPKYHKRHATPPVDTAELTDQRELSRMKSIILGRKVWDSLTSEFQAEIITDAADFEKEEEYDGVLLWEYLRRTIKPSTKVGAANLKSDIETKTLANFEHNVLKYNLWFTDTRVAITAEEGEGYNEYLRHLFKAYLSSVNPDFLEAVKEKHRSWIQGSLDDTFDCKKLMDLGRVTYNNLVEDGSFVIVPKKGPSADAAEQKSFLALATEILKKCDMTHQTGGGGKNSKERESTGPRIFRPWRFENPNNEATKEIKGTIMKWCTNDCHKDGPMWCGRKNCLNQADFAKTMTDKRNREGNSRKPGPEMGASEDFKIALAAMVSADDYATLKEQFLKD